MDKIPIVNINGRYITLRKHEQNIRRQAELSLEKKLRKERENEIKFLKNMINDGRLTPIKMLRQIRTRYKKLGGE